MDKKIIKMIIIRVVVLTAVFIISVFIIGSIINRTEDITTQSMEAASLPVVYFEYQDYIFNETHGYMQSMDLNYMRDSLTPVSADRQVSLRIKQYESEIDRISYRISSTDGETLYDNQQTVAYFEEGDYLTAEIEVQSNIKVGTEYMLAVSLHMGEEQANYYTRIIILDKVYTYEYLRFTNQFLQMCLTGSSETELQKYIEEDDSVSASTYANVNINSRYEAFTWGDLGIELAGDVSAVIKEMNDTTTCIQLSYLAKATDPDGAMEYYRVTEFFRVSYSADRMKLLTYERNTEECFITDTGIFTSSGINLGIRSSEVDHVSDSSGSVVAFVQDGELWSYNADTAKLSKVFSFQASDRSEVRSSYASHDFKIMDVDSAGNVSFIVYGYMNRGEHEGQNGVGVYKFSSDTNAIEELVFISSPKPVDILAEDVEKVTYVNSNNIFYFMTDGSIFEINLDTLEYQVIASDLYTGNYAVGSSSSYAAWINANSLKDSTAVTILNVNDGTTREISCADDERIQPIGFLGNDFIYGIAKISDISEDSSGELFFPMYVLKIVDENGDTLRTYQSDNVYVTDVRTEGSTLILYRAKKEGESFASIENDQLKNSALEESSSNMITSSTGERKLTQIILKVSGTLSNSSYKLLTPKQIVYKTSKQLELVSTRVVEECFYVYAYGYMYSSYRNANEAILEANDVRGVVVDQDMTFIWQRSSIPEEIEIDLSEIPSALLTGELDVGTLKDEIEDAVVLDLSGIELGQVDYLIGSGTAVAAKTSSGTVVIIGYDYFGNYILYNTSSSSTQKMGPNDTKSLFEAAGNIFVSYIYK